MEYIVFDDVARKPVDIAKTIRKVDANLSEVGMHFSTGWR